MDFLRFLMDLFGFLAHGFALVNKFGHFCLKKIHGLGFLLQFRLPCLIPPPTSITIVEMTIQCRCSIMYYRCIFQTRLQNNGDNMR